MKVLELNFAKTWRGGERQTLFCMQGFRKKGLDVDLLCREGYPLAQRSRDEGFATHAFEKVSDVIKFLIIHGRKYDIIHAQTAHILTYCLLTKLFHRRKVVYTRRVDFVPRGFLTLLKYRLTDELVAISTAIKRIINEFSHRNATLISSVITAKELDKTRALNEIKAYNPENKKVVGTVAALVQHKDPLTMVESVKTLSELRQDFVFLHFGTGDLEAVVKEKIEEFGLQDVYKLVGFKDRVEDFYAVIDVFVMSSEEEGLGSSVLDAFIYKVPVVSTDAGGLSDLVTEGRAVACSVKNADEIAQGIDKVLSDKNMVNLMTNKAYEYVVKEHDIDNLSGKYVALFRKMLDQ